MVRINGGFLVLNYMKFRERDYTAAERSRRYREKCKADVASRRDAVTSHRDAVTSHRDITQAEADAEVEEEEKANTTTTTSAAAQPVARVEGDPGDLESIDFVDLAAEAATSSLSSVLDLDADSAPSTKHPVLDQMNATFAEIGRDDLVHQSWQGECKAAALSRIQEDPSWQNLLTKALHYVRLNNWFRDPTNKFGGQYSLVKPGTVKRYADLADTWEVPAVKTPRSPAKPPAPAANLETTLDADQQAAWDALAKIWPEDRIKESDRAAVARVVPGTCEWIELVDCAKRYLSTKPKFVYGLGRFIDEKLSILLPKVRDGDPVKETKEQRMIREYHECEELAMAEHSAAPLPIHESSNDAMLDHLQGVFR